MNVGKIYVFDSSIIYLAPAGGCSFSEFINIFFQLLLY